jgi:hypothetical protein
MLLIVIGSISFSVLANNIETKADLEKLVAVMKKQLNWVHCAYPQI